MWHRSGRGAGMVWLGHPAPESPLYVAPASRDNRKRPKRWHGRLARGLLDRLGPVMGFRSGSAGGECPPQRTRRSGSLPAPRLLRLSRPADEGPTPEAPAFLPWDRGPPSLPPEPSGAAPPAAHALPPKGIAGKRGGSRGRVVPASRTPQPAPTNGSTLRFPVADAVAHREIIPSSRATPRDLTGMEFLSP